MPDLYEYSCILKMRAQKKKGRIIQSKTIKKELSKKEHMCISIL
jgi:hypothetical protein